MTIRVKQATKADPPLISLLCADAAHMNTTSAIGFLTTDVEFLHSGAAGLEFS